MSGWDFMGAEDRDGVRFSWNMWPSSRLEATRIVVPVGCLFTPLKVQHPQYQLAAVEYDPVRCKNSNCGAILNPWCQVDFTSKLWTCPFCLTRNHFPPHYAEFLSEQNLPAELIPQYTTLEYELPNRRAGPPVFVFVVDTCLPEEQLEELKDSLQQALNLLPDEALVGLVTYGTNVQLHELGYTECPKSFVFRGAKDLQSAQVASLLGIRPGGNTQYQGAAATPQDMSAIGRFLVPVSECGFSLESVLDDLSRDPWPVSAGARNNRATGTALSVAVGLLEVAVPNSGARIQLFVGGPCTVGPGRIVDMELTKTMRSHHDLIKGNAPLFQEACAHYESLSMRCVKSAHVIDIFACSLDQVGLLEMKRCVEKTGGLVVMADSFSQSVFKESFQRVFRRHPDTAAECDRGHLEMGFAGTIECLTSREFKVCGAVGPCSSLKKMSSSVSENEVGQGSTYAWSMGGISPATTVAFYFEVVNKEDNPLPAGKCHHIQFVTTYQHSSGAYRMRVTTLGGPWHGDTQNLQPVARSFDQEAAAVLMARLAVQRAETEELPDIMRWIDRSLIRLTSKFADYREDDPLSLRMLPEFSIYPQFMFHLRRSNFLQTGNMSPDESAYHRMVLMQENTSNSLVMIQPALLSYSFNGPPQPVLLDNCSMRPDVILLLDTFFNVVVWHGETIAQWRDKRYQDDPKHTNFRNLLSAPGDDALLIIETRFPVPRYIVCDQHKSQARFLMAKLNPSVTHNHQDGAAVQAIFTDDVSLKVFMDSLVKLAVQK
jgi:protein transport protein SEC23|eukprot:Stramenopile-MAST_4_protein_3435